MSETLSFLLRHVDQRGTDASHWGSGSDEYEPAVLHYPEAYAKYAVGLMQLARVTGDSAYVGLAGDLLDHLWDLRSKEYSLPCWGLPFDYSGVGAWTPYLLTTAFCGEAYRFYASLTGASAAARIARGAAEWVMEVNGGDVDCSGSLTTLYYSPHPKRRYFIPNAASIAFGFMVEMGLAADLVGVRQTLSAWQDSHGRWPYSDGNLAVDLVHTAYSLEGLVRGQLLLKTEDTRGVIAEGMAFMWKGFYQGNDAGREKALHSPCEIGTVGFSRVAKDAILAVAPRFLVQRWHPYSRLWGQAAALRVFAYAGTGYGEQRGRVRQIILERYADGDGTLVYRPDNRVAYVRHSAHGFEALAHCLVVERGLALFPEQHQEEAGCET